MPGFNVHQPKDPRPKKLRSITATPTSSGPNHQQLPCLDRSSQLTFGVPLAEPLVEQG